MPDNISNSINPPSNNFTLIQQVPINNNLERNTKINITDIFNQDASLVQLTSRRTQGNVINTESPSHSNLIKITNETKDVISHSAIKRKSSEDDLLNRTKRKYEHSPESKTIVNAEKIGKKPLSIDNLPTELIRDTAFKLDTRSYFNLRATSHGMREILPSFEDINKVFQGKYSGKTKKDYTSIYQKTLISELNAQKNHDLLNTLKSISVISSADGEHFDNPIIAIKFMTYDTVKSYYNEGDDCYILSEWLNIAIENPDGSSLDNDITIDSFSPADNSFSCNTARFEFDASTIEKDNLERFFYSFEILFKEYGEKERLILATTAYRLIQALKENTPVNLNENDISQYESQYPILFGLGAAIDDYLSTEKQGIASDYFEHLDYTQLNY